MSSVPPTIPPAPPTTTPPPLIGPASELPNEITIVSHSNLFYWWPVWAVGFVLSILTYFSGYVVALVPTENSRRIPAAQTWDVKIGDTMVKREGMVH